MTDSTAIIIEDHRYFATVNNQIEEMTPNSINKSDFEKVSVKTEEDLEKCIEQSPCVSKLGNAANIVIDDIDKKISYDIPMPLFCKLLLQNSKESKLDIKYKTTSRCLELKIDRNNVVYEKVEKDKSVIRNSYFYGKRPDGLPSIIDCSLINTMIDNLQHSLNIHFFGDAYLKDAEQLYFRYYDTHDFSSTDITD